MSYQYLTDRLVKAIRELGDLGPEAHGLPDEAAACARRGTITGHGAFLLLREV
jgi:hypothetical protein